VGRSTSGDIDIINVPVNVHGRYYFDPEGSFSPYVKAGLSYNIASGDYLETSNVGVFGGLGVELYRTNSVSWGIEAIIDSSTIEIEKTYGSGTKTEPPVAFKLGVFIIF
jgi:outer membrane protein W